MQRNKDRAVETEFLLDGKHKVEFDFPWERPRPAFEEETDVFEAEPTTSAVGNTQAQSPVVNGVAQVSNSTLVVGQTEFNGHSQEPTSPTRTSLLRGISLAITRNRSKDTVVQIAMDDRGNGGEGEDQGMDEGKRWELATEKWRERRRQMDIELKRLRHNEERARRFSGAFVHQALDPREQQNHYRRSQSSQVVSGSSKPRVKLMEPGRKSRSQSMQIKSPVAKVWSNLNDRLVPRLQITEEEEEEEDEEDAGLGLPPKDIPFYEEKMTGVALDMSQIPVAEIAESIHSQASDHSWNTGGEQDDAV